MERYIHEQNLARYSKVLSETIDQAKRATVLKLIAEEQANVYARTATKWAFDPDWRT